MGIFNHISKLSKSNVQSGNAIFDLVMTDYAKKDDLTNYHNKSEPPLTMSIDLNINENQITFLGDPVDENDAINKSFLNKRITYAIKIYN